MNFKKIILGSAIAAASFGLVACGDDGSSGSKTPTGPDAPTGPEIKPIEQSSLVPVLFSGISMQPMAGDNGMRGSLSGMVKLDPDFVNPDVPYTPDAVTMIDSVNFKVGRIVDGKAYQENITINLDGVVFPAERVSFAQKFFEYSQLSGCGDFRLYVYVYSSTKEEGQQTSKYTNADTSLTFSRPQTDCEVAPPPSSSSEVVAQCTPVTATPVTLSNSMGTSQSAINFATGLADNPHISIKFANNAAMIVPGAGVTVYEDNAQTTGLEAQPKAGQTQICREDFAKSNYQFDEELTSGLWLDVVTAEGTIYPVMVKKAMFESATKGSVDIVYYK